MDRPVFTCLRPGQAPLSRDLKFDRTRFLPRVLVVSLAMALAACASRGGDEVVDEADQPWTHLSDEATDETGEIVVNQALLRQARDELAVLSQPASAGQLETLAASGAPRPVRDLEAAPSATASAAPGPDDNDRIRSSVSPVMPAEAPGARASTASMPDAAPPAAPITEGSAAASGQPDAGAAAAEGERPGLFGRMFGWFRSNPAEAGTAAETGAASQAGGLAEAGAAGGVAAGPAIAPTATSAATPAASSIATPTPPLSAATPTPAAVAPVDTTDNVGGQPVPVAATAAAVPTHSPRPGLPGPGEPGYIISGHSSGAMLLAQAGAGAGSRAMPASVTDAALTPPTPVTPATPVATPATPVGPAAAATGPASRAVVDPAPAGNVIVSPIGPAGQASGPLPGGVNGGNGGNGGSGGAPVRPAAVPVEPPTMTAALRQPATPALPAVAEVAPLDRNQLERGSFATLMGAMHGMVERCEPPTQMRDQAMKTYRATYPAVDLDRRERDDPAVRLRADEEFARSAAATLGSGRVNCDYVRSQSYGWNQLVGDLRHMNRDSARQYRPGLITEITRGAGLGNN